MPNLNIAQSTEDQKVAECAMFKCHLYLFEKFS